MRFNENEYCIEMTADEICSLVSRASDLDSLRPAHMNVNERGFDTFLSQLPDYDRAHEPVRAQEQLINTAQIHGNYYTVTAVADRAYKHGEIGTVDLFCERRAYGDMAFPNNFEISLLKIQAYFYACKHVLQRVDARIVICFKDTKKIKIIEDSFTADQLKKSYFELLERVDFFAKLMVERKITVWLRDFCLNQPLSHSQEAFHQL